MNVKSVLIVAGGTGGHLSPGIALYEEFRERGVSVKFLTGRRDLRFSSMVDIIEDDREVYSTPSLTKNPLKLPVFFIRFLLGMLKARKVIKRHNAGAVIGMGGYATGPALMAARLMDVPIYLCEQNSVPGRVTRYFEKSAVAVFGTFEVSRKFLKYGDRFVHAGNPIRRGVLSDISKEEARKAFHLGYSRKVILAIGGSQGAVRINELVFGLKEKYSDELKNVGFIWSTGDLSYEKYKESIQDFLDEGSIYLSPFIAKVGVAYRACDLAICRSGAGVIMELAAMGIPSIQIPYPFAAMNHQDTNAEEFVRVGAAIKIANDDAVPEKVIDVLLELLNNNSTLQRMSGRARSIAMVDASSVIAADIMERSGIEPVRDEAEEEVPGERGETLNESGIHE